MTTGSSRSSQTHNEPTPGPWVAEDMEFFPGILYVSNDDHYQIAAVLDDGQQIESTEVIANGRLIAAAPDLLAALEALYAYAKEMSANLIHQPTGGSKVRAQVEAAIAKARGAS